MKRIVSYLLLTVFLLALSSSSLSDIVDSEKPQIDIETLSANKETGTIGDSITVSIKMTDNIGITSAVICLDNRESGNSVNYASMTYDSTIDKWCYTFSITENTSNGTWAVSNIQAYDAVGNAAVTSPWIDVFTVYGAADSEKPQIFIDTLTASASKGTVGDTVIISIKITDNIGLSGCIISLDNRSSGNMLAYKEMTYNAETDRWEYAFEIKEETSNGIWIVSNIQAYDIFGNRAGNSPWKDIITVYGAADSEKPVIDMESLEVSADQATYDDHVLIAFKVTDDTDVNNVVISLDNRNTGKMFNYKSMTRRPDTDIWEYDFYIGEDVSDGEWEISNIQARDAIGNAGVVSPHQLIVTTNHVYDFESKANFVLPNKVNVISDEAFYGCKTDIVAIPMGCKSIGAKAFANSESLHRIFIPSSVTSIASDAFENSERVIIYSTEGTKASEFANDHDIPFVLNE